MDLKEIDILGAGISEHLRFYPVRAINKNGVLAQICKQPLLLACPPKEGVSAGVKRSSLSPPSPRRHNHISDQLVKNAAECNERLRERLAHIAFSVTNHDLPNLL
jgi:hypothetical protein